MPNVIRGASVALVCSAAFWLCAFGAPPAALPLALQGVNPDSLSGASFRRLHQRGAFGPAATPPRAQASYPDVSKGRPPAVLDPRVGVNVRLLDDPDPLPAAQRGQAEPHIYRSAADPELLLATFQDGRFADGDGGALVNGYAVSRDGGLTWTRALAPALTSVNGGPYFRATDPVAAIGPQGDFYLNGLAALDAIFDQSAVVLHRSTDQGATWTRPLVIFQSANAQTFADKNWLVVNDLPAAPNRGRLVATWTNFTSTANGTATGNNIVAAVSDDRGDTWTASVNVTPAGSSNQGSQPFFLPDGSLGVVYITFFSSNNVTSFSINFKRSTDGGLTFPTAATNVAGFVSGWDDPELRDGVFLPAATVARQTGEIFVTFAAVVAGSPRIMLTKSTDLGATWTSPLAISDQPAGVSVMNPAVATSPDGRTVGAVFIDKRQAPGGRGFVDHYAALSFDHGVTWQPNFRLSEVSSDLRYGPPTPRGVMLGDYLALAASPASTQSWVAIWCDTRTGDSDPFVARFAASPQPDLAAWSVARFTSEQLRIGGLDELDPDHDGYSNRLEFLLGTNPQVAESGEVLVLSRPSADVVDVTWMQRPLGDIGSTIDAHLEGLTAPAIAPSGTPANLQLPSAAAPGLEWRGLRYPVPAGTPFFAAQARTTVSGAPPRIFVRPEATPAAINTTSRIINIATRGQAGAAGNPLIVGFVLDGNKSVLIRAAGPSLAATGLTDTLGNPQLTLTSPGSDFLQINDNWQQGGATSALFVRLGAFPFAPNSLDAALALPLGARDYSAIVSSANPAPGGAQPPGLTLVEVYDADSPPGGSTNARLLNLSTRGEVGLGENALVSGFVLTGTQPRRVLIRAIGPTLAGFGVPGVLPDPLLTLFRGATQLAANDDWEISRSAAANAAVARRVGGFPLAPGSLDAALLMTLEPGSYTAIVTGVGGGTGIALVEIYDAD